MSNKNFFKNLVKLNVMIAVLPESKVSGTDMWGNPTKRKGLKMVLESTELAARESMSPQSFNALMERVEDRVKDILQELQDKEDDLYKNETVDDPNTNFKMMELEDHKNAFFTQKQAERQVYNLADEGQKRHERMVMRLAIVAKLKEEDKHELVDQVNDNLVERILAGEAVWDESLRDFQVSEEEILKKEKEVLYKNQASYFRSKLQTKAAQLRTLADQASDDASMKKLVIKMANKTKVWCELKTENPKPYSKRAVNALYNMSVQILVEMGVFKQAFLRREYNPFTKKFDGEPCSFNKKVQQDMVEVKSGLNWQEEVATLFYEQNDGNNYQQPGLF